MADDVEGVLSGMTNEALTSFVAEKGVATPITDEAPVEAAVAADHEAEGEVEETTTEEPTTETVEEPSLDIDGQKYTAKEIRELRTAARKADDLERQMADARTESESLSVWKEMHSLAQKYPALREKLAEVFSEFEKNPEISGKPIEARELSDDEKVRAAYIDNLIVKEAGAEIDTIVKGYAEKYPEHVKFTDEWMSSVLLPAVEERFPNMLDRVGPRHIKMALNDLLMERDVIGAAEKKGATDIANRLAKEPAGSRIVRGESTRKDSTTPEVSLKGKSIDEMMKIGASQFFANNGR